MGLVVVDELFDLRGGGCWDSTCDFGFVKAVCVGAASLCFYVEESVVDLEIKDALACFGDSTFDSFELLSDGRIEIAGGECLAVDDDDWYWCWWRS